MIRLKQSKAYVVRGKLKYLVSYDHAAGRDNRYTVVIVNCDDPVTIGRELDLATVRELISDYEATAPISWFGDRRTALKVMRQVMSARREKFERIGFE